MDTPPVNTVDAGAALFGVEPSAVKSPPKEIAEEQPPPTPPQAKIERLESVDNLPPAPANLAESQQPVDDQLPLPAPPPEVEEASEKLQSASLIDPVPAVSVTLQEAGEGGESEGGVSCEKKGFSGIFNENLSPGKDEMAAAVSVTDLNHQVNC